MFLCVLDAQGEGGASPTQAGLLFAPFNLAVIAGPLLGPRLDGRGPMPAGLLAVAAGAALLPLGWTLAGFVAMGVVLGVASVASAALAAAAARALTLPRAATRRADAPCAPAPARPR